MTTVVAPLDLSALLDRPFTDAQLGIAQAPLAPQLVVAGAGSGKTTVMAARAVYAVGQLGIPPARILGLTFTNKAAGELAERVRWALASLPSERSEPGAGAADELPMVATYHSYAAGIVRDHALRIGREPTATLLTEAQQWQLAMRVVRRAPGPVTALRQLPTNVAGYVVALAGEMAEHLADAGEVRAHDHRVLAALDQLERSAAVHRDLRQAIRQRDELLDLVARYLAEKARLDTLDFGDQVALAVEIVDRSPEVVAVERGRFDLVVLDEYQDTGVAQRRLLTALFGAGHPVTAVGDPNQAIYGWRGASVGNLLRFREHFSSTPDAIGVHDLMTSFRSGSRIVAAAAAVAAPLAASGPALPVSELAPRVGAPTGEVVAARLLTVTDEASWVADQVADAVRTGTPPGDIAVLCRRRSDFSWLLEALVSRGLPAEVVGLGGLIDTPEVADVVAVLSVLAEPTANPALIRVLTGPRWRIGVRDLAALGRRAVRLAASHPMDADPDDTEAGGVVAESLSDASGAPAGDDGAARLDRALREATAATDPVEVVSLLEAVERPGHPAAYSPEALERFRLLATEIATLRATVGQPLVDLVAEVVTTLGLDVEIEAGPAAVAAARAANLAAFADVAAGFTGLDGESDLGAFLAYLVAAGDVEDGLDIGAVSDSDSVKILTVHKAKGLEWDVVAVPGLSRDVFPVTRGRSTWLTGGQVLPTSCRGDAADLPVPGDYTSAGLTAVKQAHRDAAAAEERRLAYVAFTRARHQLLLSSSCWSATRKTPLAVSPFLAEVCALGAPTVRVDQWCEDPEPGAANPLRASVADIGWPVALDAAAATAREQAAADVRDARTGVTADGGLAGSTRAMWRREVDAVIEDLQEAARATVDVELPRRLTAIQLVTLAHDPEELARSIARPLPRRPVRQARRGSRFHLWLEQRHGGGVLFDADELPGSGEGEQTDAELAELQAAFLASPWAARVPAAVEVPFELVIAGRAVRGRIDAVYDDGPGTPDVIDYKTGAVPADLTAAALQLSVYRLAWSELTGVAVDDIGAGFLYVRSGEVLRPALLDAAGLDALLGGVQPSA